MYLKMVRKTPSTTFNTTTIECKLLLCDNGGGVRGGDDLMMSLKWWYFDWAFCHKDFQHFPETKILWVDFICIL